MKCLICKQEIDNENEIECENDVCDTCFKKAYELGKGILLKQVIQHVTDEELMKEFDSCMPSQKKMYMSEMKKRGLR